jgi:hypothetical protein
MKRALHLASGANVLVRCLPVSAWVKHVATEDEELPGCKSVKMTQAEPSASDPDLYLEESCPQGTFIRAMTADGREIWRRRVGDGAAPPPLSLKTQTQAPPGEHLNLNSHSLCDDVSYGMAHNRESCDTDQLPPG